MAGPRSVRFDEATDAGLSSFVARRPGLSRSSAAALLVEEGLRMDAHPGVVFRDGPAGRRAAIAGGPDVWEAVRAIRSARGADGDLAGEELLALVADVSGLPASMLRLAVAYYADYPAEIDAILADAADAEAAAEKSVQRRKTLLGA